MVRRWLGEAQPVLHEGFVVVEHILAKTFHQDLQCVGASLTEFIKDMKSYFRFVAVVVIALC